MNLVQRAGQTLLALAVMAAPTACARAATPLAVGATAPAYSVPDQDGKTRTLAQDKGRVVLLAFYPADFTGGCTIEAHSLTGAAKDLQAMGVKVYGVSVQDSKSHKGFCTKEGITYTLLADTNRAMSKAYGVVDNDKGYASRVTYIIGKDGKVAYVDPNVNGHITTCGPDWVAWLKAHPDVTGKSARTAGAPDAPTSIQNFRNTSDNVAGGIAPAQATLGQKTPTFTLTDVTTGASTSLDSIRQGKKATVVIFIATRCPISNGYNERMVALAKKYGAQGVAFVGINANGNESIAECKAHAAEHQFPFPVLKDTGNKVADAYDARVTPEAYVLNADGVLVYHGRIDNDVDPQFVNTHELADALDNVLAGQPVAKASTKAFGCSIKRVS